MISGLIGFLIAIVILVFVHEIGHYVAARLSGVPVLAFSIGFGKVLYTRIDKRGCEWRISAIPLGGYVKMLSVEEKEDLQTEYPNRHFDWDHAFELTKAYKRLFVVLAGPAMNLIFAALLYSALAINGGYEVAPRMGVPLAGSQAESAHVQAGWIVEKIGKTPVASFNDIQKLLSKVPEGKSVSVFFRNDTGESAWVDFHKEKGEGNKTFPFGLTPSFHSVAIGHLEANSAAEAAGIKPGETVLSANGVAIVHVQTLIDMIRASAGKAIELKLTNEVDGVTRTIQITPRLTETETGEKVYRIGATLLSLPEVVLVKYGPVEALAVGVRQVAAVTVMSVKSIARMFVGQESLSSLAGPVTIGNLAGKSLNNGFKTFVNFMALISIALGITNLIPIPVLDGGQAVIALWEMGTGKRLSQTTLSILARIGMGLLLALFALALVNDFVHLFS